MAKKVMITLYEFNELNEYAKEKAIENFKYHGCYEYAYSWSKEKVANKIIEIGYMFKSNGEFENM